MQGRQQASSTDPTLDGPLCWQGHPAIDSKKEARSLYNLLMSIREDVKFVEKVLSKFPNLPVVANLRCGAWYSPAHKTSSTSYFKSTDGHTHQWSFSLKRSNLHLIPLIQALPSPPPGSSRDSKDPNASEFISGEESDPSKSSSTLRSTKLLKGCVVIDSTRRGKSMPDSLTKTLPIWCSVLNLASFQKYGVPKGQDSKERVDHLRVHKRSVTPSERDQIASRIQGWVEELVASDLEVPRLEEPLFPLFIHPDSGIEIEGLMEEVRGDGSCGERRRGGEDSPPFLPIILVSASKCSGPVKLKVGHEPFLEAREQEARRRQKSDFVYIQGAGDDHENWAGRLTPEIFWRRWDEIFADVEGGREEGEEEEVDDVERRRRFEERVERILMEEENNPNEGKDAGEWFTPLADDVDKKSRRWDKTETTRGGDSGGGDELERLQEPVEILRTGVFVCKRPRLRAEEREGNLKKGETERFDLVVDCSSEPLLQSFFQGERERAMEGKVLRLGIQEGKRGIPGFVKTLPLVTERVAKLYEHASSGDGVDSGGDRGRGSEEEDPQGRIQILVMDQTGKDVGNSIAILILSRYFDGKGRKRQSDVTKDTTRRRLQWLVSSLPLSNPSRSHLLRVNEFLIRPEFLERKRIHLGRDGGVPSSTVTDE